MTDELPDRPRETGYGDLLTLIFWGFLLVVFSFLFLYVGYRLDQKFNTAPFLMIGLFLLAVLICLGKFYQVAWRKWAEQELRESERRLSSILQGSPTPTFVLGKDHRVLYWNRACEVLSRIKAADVVGTTNHWKAFYTTERPCMADLLVNEAPEEIPGWYSGMFIKSTLIDEAYLGTDFFPALGEKGTWLRFTAAVIRDSGGKLIGAVETLEDITELKRAEEELTKVQRLESLGTMADGIAHDFSSLLSAMLRNIFVAKISVTDDDKIIEQGLEIAEKAGLQAKELANRLITFAQGGHPVKKIMSMAALLRETAAVPLRDSNVHCNFDLPDDLWLVEIDDKQMKQVVQNLISNAREAMPKGGVVYVRAQNVTVSERENLPLREGKYVKWSVEDHGMGIADEHRERIFEPYFTTKQKSETTGIGLGLAICYSIVKKHNGFIAVHSEYRVGTTVDIYLPAAQAESLANGRDAHGSALRRKRILVMDHDPVMRDVMGIMLNFLGYDAAAAKDEEEAVRLFKMAVDEKQPFTASFLDATMPEGGGVDGTLRKLLGMDPQAKAVIAGDDPHQPVMSEFRTYGFSAAITRPYSMDALKTTLNTLQL
jgi:signal transduction histidine kinase